MAKDRRGNSRQRQVNLAEKAGSRPAAKKKPAKKMAPGKIVLLVLLMILIAVSVVFIVYVARYIYDSLVTPKKKGPDVILSSYTTTPEGDKDKVAYYLVGLLGKEETSDTEMLSLVCFDKKAKSISVLQVPKDTYLGEDDQLAVKRAGAVWANPKPLDWCDNNDVSTCRKRLYEPEIQDGKHTVCGTAVTQKPGSPSGNLIDLFNRQYAMPVDGFFLLPQEALVKLVDQAGGVDVNLEADLKVGEITYKKGLCTLDGEAALAYVLNHKTDVAGDIDGLVRQRKVFLSLFQRLTATYDGFDTLSDDKLTDKRSEDKILAPVMSGKTPVRVAMDTDTGDMMRILGAMADVPLEKITVWVLPGQAAKSGGTNYFSPHRQELAALLNENFNPYGREIGEGDLRLTELANTKAGDTHRQVMSEIAVTQSGNVTPTTTAPAASQ